MPHFVLVCPNCLSLSDVKYNGPRSRDLPRWRRIILEMLTAITTSLACGVNSEGGPRKPLSWDQLSAPANVIFFLKSCHCPAVHVCVMRCMASKEPEESQKCLRLYYVPEWQPRYAAWCSELHDEPSACSEQMHDRRARSLKVAV